MKASLAHRPDGPWKFDEAVADVFDDMAERSIPLYHETIELLARQAASHLDAGDTVVDLGVATGATLQGLRDHLPFKLKPTIREIGVDNSPEMVAQAREKLIGAPELIEWDLRQGLPPTVLEARPKAIFCLWTAMFVPLEYRQELFAQCRRAIKAGGRLYVAEKLRGQTAAQQRDMVREYRAWKLRHGYESQMVDEKARSLEGVLVSLDAPSMKAMLTAEGWSVEEMIRYLGFAAWQCIPAGVARC